MFAISAKLRAIHFLHPEFFSLEIILWGVLVGLISILIIKYWSRPKKAFDSRFKIIGRDAAWIAVIILTGLMIVSAAGPYIPHMPSVQTAGNIDLIVAFDKSASMAAQDVKPSRHDVAIKLISQLASSSILIPGDRVTLFTFGYQSNWRMPLSTDWKEFQEALFDIDHPKDRIYLDDSQWYTDIPSVLVHVPASLDRQDKFYATLPQGIKYTWTAYPRIMILVSDGDDSSPDSLSQGLKELKRRDVPVYAIGIGTENGAIIKLKHLVETEPGHEMIKEEKVLTRLEPKVLREIASQTGGELFIIDSSDHNGLAFVRSAISQHRTAMLTQIAEQKPEGFWRTLLVGPSILLILFIIWKIL